MHEAVCDKCGKDCQVPFRPTGEKPIFCSDCFEKKGGRDSNRSRGRRGFRRNYGDRNGGNVQLGEKIDILSIKLDRIIELLSVGKKKKKPKKKSKKDKNK